MEGKVVQRQVQLKVGLYPRLGDVGQGEFAAFVKRKFEEKHPEIELNVKASWDDWDPYNIDNYEAYLSVKDDSFDILEMDTILLGEVVDKQLLYELDEKKYKIKERNLEIAANAVCYKGKYYAIPTLQCANFLVELAAGDLSPDQQIFRKLLALEKITFDEFLVVMEASKHAGIFDDGTMIGNLRGSYTLPCYYLHAYINHYSGDDVVQRGMEATIGDEKVVLNRMNGYSSLGKIKSLDVNPCISPEKVYEDPSKVIEVMRTANHRIVHAYSETIGQILADEQCQARKIKSYGVISPPFMGAQDKLLAYTDALIVNKHHYQAKAEAIDLFIEFYTSLDVRNELAKGEIAPNPTYFMMSQKDFYINGFGAKDQLYKEFLAALLSTGGSRAMSGPNNGFVGKRKSMEEELVKDLGWPLTS